MNFVDTHTHLYLNDFNDDREAMVSRAMAAGVQYMLLPHIDSRTTQDLHFMAKQFPGHCIPMMGLHPTSVKEDYRDEMQYIEAHLAGGKYCAVGEVGIDLYWDTSYQHAQTECFHRQISLAVEYDLPLVIHSRNSTGLILDILAEYQGQGLKGVMHCFPGDPEQAMQAIRLGFMLGIGGVVTYKNSMMSKVVEHTSLEHLLLETDAPFLSPVPKRGMRNESAFIPYIAEKISQIKGITLEEVAEVTTRNAKKLFNLQ